MPPAEFEPTISAGERPQIYALDRVATGTGLQLLIWNVNCIVLTLRLVFRMGKFIIKWMTLLYVIMHLYIFHLSGILSVGLFGCINNLRNHESFRHFVALAWGFGIIRRQCTG
jgi:hypothetical protein